MDLSFQYLVALYSEHVDLDWYTESGFKFSYMHLNNYFDTQANSDPITEEKCSDLLMRLIFMFLDAERSDDTKITGQILASAMNVLRTILYKRGSSSSESWLESVIDSAYVKSVKKAYKSTRCIPSKWMHKCAVLCKEKWTNDTCFDAEKINKVLYNDISINVKEAYRSLNSGENNILFRRIIGKIVFEVVMIAYSRKIDLPSILEEQRKIEEHIGQ